MEIVKRLLDKTVADRSSYRPIFFRIQNQQDKAGLEQLISSGNVLRVWDELDGQLRELVKSLHPSVKIKAEEYPELVKQHLNGCDISEYGVWVYYPWNGNLIHLLDEAEFIEIRTNRNRYKITREEQQQLAGRVIGIVGLSVGQSIALTLATERTCGELRLADFDTVELSNLNRIRTGLHNLGLNKTIIAAREIAELDPYIKVQIFQDGLHSGNIDAFFTEGGKLDLLVEVCDGLDVKITSRFKAKSLGIPVVMDTNDRGMLDIERFDLEPERPILHGLAEGLDPDNIKGLSNEDKIPYILKIVGAEQISTRLKASMIEVEQSINTWPQLASSVVLGGAATTDVCRRILLNQLSVSGRFYLDMDELVKDEWKPEGNVHDKYPNPHTPLTLERMHEIADACLGQSGGGDTLLSEEQFQKLGEAAVAAPSAGNNQPWKWLYKNGVLLLFHDKYVSRSWGDYFELGAHLGLGAAIANIELQSAALGLKARATDLPMEEYPMLISAIRFEPDEQTDEVELALAAGLFERHTNRRLGLRQKLDDEYLRQLPYIGREKGLKVYVEADEAKLSALGDVMASCDRIRLLNRYGHEEFFHELRWSDEEADATRDGIELSSADLTASEMAGFRIARDWNAISLLSEWDKGQAFKKNSQKAARAASAFALFTMPELTHRGLLTAGREIERFWIRANQSGVAVHPMLSPVFFFNRLLHGRGEELSEAVQNELGKLRERFLQIFPLSLEEREVFLVKLAVAPAPAGRTLRKKIDDIFFKG